MSPDVSFFTVVSTQIENLAADITPCLDEFENKSVRYQSYDNLVMPASPNEIVIVDFNSIQDGDSRLQDILGDHPYIVGLFSAEEAESFSSRAGCCAEIVSWPGDKKELVAKLKRLLRHASIGCRLEKKLALKLSLMGESEIFQQVISNVDKYSKCNVPILILGETGAGKEQIARAIHYFGINNDQTFVAVNCGALPDSLVENELFGHAKGAYTDAKDSQPGLVEQAEGGSLFLDEIEALSPKGQVSLLRFLQDYEYRPLGSRTSKKANIRIITASNEPLEDLVNQGLFRKDLFYRINILLIDLPALRERAGDVALLAEHFVDKYRERYQQYDKYLDPATLEWMTRYDWPGNVRELENLILREFLLSDGPCISIAPFKGTVGERRKCFQDRRFRHLYNRNFQEAKSAIVSEFERSYLKQALDSANGNVSKAARKAGKERRTFAKLMDKHGLDKKQFHTD